MLVFFPFFIGKFRIPNTYFYFASYFVLIGMYNIYVGNNTPGAFLKIFLGLFMSYLFYYFVFRAYQINLQLLFKLYLLGAYIMAVIGLIQLISFLLGITPGYDFTWILNKSGPVLGGNLGIRINSFYSEPSQFAITQSPAAFVAIYSLLQKAPKHLSKFRSWIILLTYLFTFSSLGYMGIFIIFLLLIFNLRLTKYLIFIVPLLVLIFNLLYNYVDEFRIRFDDTISVFTTSKFQLGKSHGSSIILYDNFHVTVENFKENFLFGSGLGSHSIAFEKHSITKSIRSFGFDGNSQDANSMMLRIISETGLFGIVLTFWFLFKFYTLKNEDDDDFWLISNSALVLILLFLFRQGHYFINGFPFFVFLYHYAHQQAKQKILTNFEKAAQ